MEPIDQSPLEQSLPPSARLALLHQENVDANNGYVPLIAGDHPSPIGQKPVELPSTKKEGKLDLSSEDAFPVLSSPSPRTPVVSSWSSAASRLKVSSPNPQQQAATPAHIQDTLELSPKQLISKQPSKQLGSKSTAEVIAEVEKRTGVKLMASTNRTGTLKILIRGNKSDVLRAKDDLRAELTVKRTIKMQVPAMMRQFIVGRGGAVLRRIEDASKTSINIAKDTEEAELIDVEIIGHDEGIVVAKDEIAKVVSANAIKDTLRNDRFDPSYLLLLKSKLAALEQEFSVKVRTPVIGSTNSHVSITGERDMARAAMAQLEEQYNVVKNESRKATIGIGIAKLKHKYLAGKDGEALERMLNETGCIFELPSPGDKSENVTIVGPEDRLVDGMSFVMKRAQKVFIQELDVAAMYGASKDAQARAQAMLNYSQQKGELKKLASDHGVVVDRHDQKLEFVGENEQHMATAFSAAKELYHRLEQVKFQTTDMDRHIFGHIAKHDVSKLQQIKSTNSVEILSPNNDSEPILVVYEGQATETAAATLEKVAETLTAMAKELDFVSQSVVLESMEMDLIRGPNDTTMNAIVGASNVYVQYNYDHSITLRGRSVDVQSVASTLRKVDATVKDGSFVKSFKAEFSIPAAYSAHVIGKAGSRINKLKNEFGVRIDIEDPTKRDQAGFEIKSKKGVSPNQQVQVVIQGVQINVEATQARISEIVTEQADRVTLTLDVPREYLGALIGPSGRFAKKLEEQYNVNLKFPKAKSESTPESSPRSGRKKDASQEAITIEGHKKNASAARDELEELYKYEKQEQAKRDTERKERDAKKKENEELKKKRDAEYKARQEARQEEKEKRKAREEERRKVQAEQEAKRKELDAKRKERQRQAEKSSATNGVHA